MGTCIYPTSDPGLGVKGIRDNEPLRWLLAERLYAWVTRAIDPRDIVLDYGCGSGYGTQIIAAWATHGYCFGVDKDATAIKYANQRCKTPRNQFVCDDVLDGDKSVSELFGAIVLVDTLSEVTAQKRLLELLLPSLRPNGRMVIVETVEAMPEIEEKLASYFLPIRGYFSFHLDAEKKGFRTKTCRYDKPNEGADRMCLVGHIIPRRDVMANKRYRDFCRKHVGLPEGGIVPGPSGNRFAVITTKLSEGDAGNADVQSLMVRDFREDRWDRHWEPGYEENKKADYAPFRKNWRENFEANREMIAKHIGTVEKLPQSDIVYCIAPGRSLEKNSHELAAVRHGTILALNGSTNRVPRGAKHKIALMVDARSLTTWIPDDVETWDLWTAGIVNSAILDAPWKSINFLRLTGSNPAFEWMNENVPEAVLVDSCLSVALVGMNLAVYMGCKTLVHVGMGDAWLAKDGYLKHHAEGTGYEVVHDVPAGAFPIETRDGKQAYINETYKQGTDAVAYQNYFFLEPAALKVAYWLKHGETCKDGKEYQEARVAYKRADWWKTHPPDESIRVIDASQCDASILLNRYSTMPQEVEIMTLSEAIMALEGDNEKKRQKRKGRRRRRRK